MHSIINRRVLLSTLAVLPIFQPLAAMAQQTHLAGFNIHEDVDLLRSVIPDR